MGERAVSVFRASNKCLGMMCWAINESDEATIGKLDDPRNDWEAECPCSSIGKLSVPALLLGS